MTVRERCPACGCRRLLFPIGVVRVCINCLTDLKTSKEATTR
jgi:hypothetical protein